METAQTALPAWAASLSFTEYRPTSTHPHVGRCRQCKCALRILSTTHKQLIERRTIQGHTCLDTLLHKTSDTPTARYKQDVQSLDSAMPH